MTHARFTAAELATMREHCTPAQYEALRLWSTGLGYKRIADILNIHPTTAHARIRDGLKRVGLDLKSVRAA